MSTINVAYAFFERNWPWSKWQRCLGRIPENLQARICRYHRWQDRLATLVGKLLVKDGLSALWGDDVLDRLAHDNYGRPYIRGTMDFNVSHSGRYVTCAFADRGRVGIDIEKVRPLDWPDFRYEFRLEEQAVIELSNDPLHSFYEHWTAKEAVVKADGRGMQIPLTDVRLDSNRAILYDKTYWLKRIQLGHGYSCCVAADREICGVIMQYSHV
ncbi:MAG: 4'-phosphopantetheinyl transferase superfamily protein [Desulfobacteraceae bacterium]|nr:4'-phosphopantetheinyl transferase superfamily protein [Desulfobacteraceae bacterium]